ncbi:MAG TPA: ATP-binding protein [Candidatus Sumerlaeota bacterium]|nr:ATP-binding protein [Candidatus Sumerlaeota bacterium]
MSIGERIPPSGRETGVPSHQQRVIDTLHRVTTFMNEVTDLKRLLTHIMEESKQAMDSEASSCMLYDDATDELYFEVALGEKGDEVKSIRLKRGQGIGGTCLAEARTLVVNDAQSDDRHDRRADQKATFVTRNLVATPMRCYGKIIGVLEVLNKRDNESFNADDVKILEVIADQAGMAITNARLVELSIQRERLAAVGFAVSGIAHHLKNIILGIKAPLGLIRMGYQGQNTKLVAEALPIIERASSRMEQSVREMLAYSKDRKPELQKGNLNVFIHDLVQETTDRAAERGILLLTDLDERIQESGVDSIRLHDAVLNLIGNAIEAHREEGEGRYIKVRTRLGQNKTVHILEVEDNGPGISPDILKNIFEPFFSTKGSRGTGLGLAIARKVAEENGGSLTARSQLGAGATFSFRLPIIDPSQVPVFRDTDVIYL